MKLEQYFNQVISFFTIKDIYLIMNINLSCLCDPVDDSELIISIDPLTSGIAKPYPIINRIPQFVNLSNYIDDFGYQWNKFIKTQLDSCVGIYLSERRLERCLGGELSSLTGNWSLRLEVVSVDLRKF